MSQPFSSQWQDWLTENLQRGCCSEDLIKVMVDAGFVPGYSACVVDVFQALISRAKLAESAGVGPTSYSGYSRIPVVQNRLLLAGRMVEISMAMRNPQIVLLDNFLSLEECTGLIDAASCRMNRSSVVDPVTGSYTEIDGRTSDGAHFTRGESPMVADIETRIAALLGIDVVFGESIQVLRYRPGGEYLPHHDYFPLEDSGSRAAMAEGGQRVATVVMYLSDSNARTRC